MRCRKDFMDLTPLERDRLASALNDLHDRGLITTFANAHEAGWFNIHRGPAFLPWHRWFILTLEEHLRAIDARITLPYWNWTRSDSRDLEAEPWKSFFGGRDNSGGRFDHWDYTRASSPGDPALGSRDTVIDELQAGSFLAFRGMEFGSHVGGHTWTGGTMASQTSPADPLFYLHHCMVDRLWAIWQINNPGADQYSLDDEDDYPTYDDTFVAAGESMFGGAIGAGVTPASMLDHRALGYYYDRDDALEARVIERQSHFDYLLGNLNRDADQLPVEGGDTLTVAYTRDELITVHRKVDVVHSNRAVRVGVGLTPEVDQRGPAVETVGADAAHTGTTP